MKNWKLLLTAALLVCMVFGLCACGSDPVGTEDTTPGLTTTAPVVTTTAPADDGKVTYTVKVVDESGKGVAGVMVQLCLEACVPTLTDASGVATWSMEEADYKAQLTTTPAGYAADTAEYYFEDGSYELTITLKAAG